MHKIKYSSHSEEKIEILKRHGLFLTKDMIENVVLKPDNFETGYKNRIIAQKKLDKKHVLRVVYEKYNDDILIITMYPARSSRYEKS